MFNNLNGKAIRSFHSTALTQETWPSEKILEFSNDPIWKHIQLNHQCNTLLWNEEDLSRRTNTSDTEIANNKRNIDKYNQLRNDYTEHLDQAILALIPSDHKFKQDVWINSETAGSIIDRMSINALRTFHMKKQINRENISKDFKEECILKLNMIIAQGDNLAHCLDTLLSAIAKGEAIFHTNKQFKMYNDPQLNPYLVDKQNA